MRYLPFALLLASCQTWGWSDTADAISPDEFTIGSGSQNLGGTFSDGVHDFDLDGEEESTYAALTWHLPSIKNEDGMDRTTQRNLSLLIDKMAEDEGVAVGDTPAIPVATSLFTPNIRKGAKLPPLWVVASVGAGLLLLVLMARRKSRRKWR